VRAWGIVPAAGRGERLGGEEPKPFIAVAGRPMLAHVLVTLSKVPGLEAIVVAVEAGWQGQATIVADEHVPGAHVEIVRGGGSRQESVRAALAVVPDDVRQVVVHDAARPLVTVELVQATLSALERAPGAICAVPVSDTLKSADGQVVGETVSRADLWRAQTPQAFRAAAFRAAHDRAAAEGFEGTDDAALLERVGAGVIIVTGDPRNIKVTDPEDLVMAEALLTAR
jgi:2-C-methyl-D-erythritol 4-phosphate cytidylyltransferase